eukprot:scaffold138971_cov21-Tisochrysis_lutea.AAC.1
MAAVMLMRNYGSGRAHAQHEPGRQRRQPAVCPGEDSMSVSELSRFLLRLGGTQATGGVRSSRRLAQCGVIARARHRCASV